MPGWILCCITCDMIKHHLLSCLYLASIISASHNSDTGCSFVSDNVILDPDAPFAFEFEEIDGDLYPRDCSNEDRECIGAPDVVEFVEPEAQPFLDHFNDEDPEEGNELLNVQSKEELADPFGHKEESQSSSSSSALISSSSSSSHSYLKLNPKSEIKDHQAHKSKSIRKHDLKDDKCKKSKNKDHLSKVLSVRRFKNRPMTEIRLRIPHPSRTVIVIGIVQLIFMLLILMR